MSHQPEIPYTNVVRYIEQEHAIFSFTGKVFYRLRHVTIQTPQRFGWYTVCATQVPRFGAYTLDEDTREVYAREFGHSGADPLWGGTRYPWYHLLVDTGIFPALGRVLVDVIQPFTGEQALFWVRDYADDPTA